ncbi:hypothetical protein GCM10023350_46400 [Nocardioides endophyticus]|uniref:Uncharacterized protein n=1 Tax=Nocardioides endophyticus TaxID=1353775 RepID=A0ABP8ZG80_9ACTN
MQFSEDPELEGLIGRVCHVYARVELEAGHVVMAAHGNWGVAMSTDYLTFSSNSGVLTDWLKNVGRAYTEVKSDARDLCVGLRSLKARRDVWAHSAAIMDLWLVMREQGWSSMSDSDHPSGKLLNAKTPGHVDAPSKADVDAFSAEASDVGDVATSLAASLARLADPEPRTVRDPTARRPSGRSATTT